MIKMPNYTLDVILPVKNGEKYIHDSVGCVLNQTIIEIIIIAYRARLTARTGA